MFFQREIPGLGLYQLLFIDMSWAGAGATPWLGQKYPDVRSRQVIDIHPSSTASGSTDRFFRWCTTGRPLLIAQSQHNQFNSPGIFVLTMKHVSPMHHFWTLQPWHSRGFFAPFVITFTKIGAPSIVTSSPCSSFKKLPNMMREKIYVLLPLLDRQRLMILFPSYDHLLWWWRVM